MPSEYFCFELYCRPLGECGCDGFFCWFALQDIEKTLFVTAMGGEYYLRLRDRDERRTVGNWYVVSRSRPWFYRYLTARQTVFLLVSFHLEYNTFHCLKGG